MADWPRFVSAGCTRAKVGYGGRSNQWASIPASAVWGLGRAVLAEGLRRLYEQGAQEVLVETDNYRNAAFALYESVGFRVARDVLVFRKDYA